MSLPQNKEAELRVLGAALNDPFTAIPVAMRIGLLPHDFSTGVYGNVWGTMVDLHSRNEPIRAPVIEQAMRTKKTWSRLVESDVFNQGYATPSQEIGYWSEVVMDLALRRDKYAAAKALVSSAQDLKVDAFSSIADEQLMLDKIATRYMRMRNPVAENPAMELKSSNEWYTTTGLGFIDRWMLPVSGELHFIAGDPGSGKSTCAIQSAAHNARRGVPVVLVLAESDSMDVRLSLLLQTKEIDGVFINRVRFDQTFKTDEHLKIVEDLWDEHYGGLPLFIYSVEQGVDEVVSIISAHTDPSLVMVDHAYAVVAQTEQAKGIREHQQFVSLFSKTRAAVKRRNHIGIMFNQFKLEGRNADVRGPDAEYGGSGVQNIASTMIHIWPEDGEAYTESGYRRMRTAIVKIRVMLLADENGFPVDPRGKEDSFWLETKYRRVEDKLPT